MSYLDDRRNRVTPGTICAGIWLFVLTFALFAGVVWALVAASGSSWLKK